MAASVDPSDLLASLSATAIVERLEDIDREARALRVLLRAARERERPRRRRQQATLCGEDAAHA